MKKYLLLFLVFLSLPAWAGRMKEIYIMTQESVLSTLGYDETVAVVEDFKFVEVTGVDLAVRTTVRVTCSVADKSPLYSCTTLFDKTGETFEVIKTDCREL